MARVRSAYQCSNCGDLMLREERTRRRVVMLGAVTAEYIQDYCLKCATKDVEDKHTRAPRQRAGRAQHQGEASSPDDADGQEGAVALVG